MKALWKGSLSFGLVNIPVQLFTATESHALGFTLLHDKCHTPLKYHRWCTHCEKEVAWDQTVKGIEKADGKYFIFTQQTLKELHPKKSENIEIIEFVDEGTIPVIYLNHHYYVAPAKKSEKAYFLFIKALENLKKAAIGRVVMRDKEYVCALQSRENYLLLTTLYYPHEIKGIANLALPKLPKVNANELQLAEALIEKLSVPKLTMTQFKDTFVQEVKKSLQAKKSKKTRAKPAARVRKEKSSLAHSLHASIQQVASRPAHAAMASRRR